VLKRQLIFIFEQPIIRMSKIIIVDDDPSHHHLAKALMKHYNFFDDYNCYTDPKSALIDLVDAYYCSLELPDVILLDLNMPDVNGWQFLEMFDNLRALVAKDIAVFIITSSIDPTDELRCESYSAVKGYFSKPLSPAILKAVTGCSVN